MANTELHLPDIANALQCIDIAAQRGAFQGRELSDVGRVRDRLESWVKENAPPTPADVQPPEPPEPPPVPPPPPSFFATTESVSVKLIKITNIAFLASLTSS